MTFVTRLLISSFLFAHVVVHAQQWVSQPISQPVPGLWGISMTDTGKGVAAGAASVGNSISGVLRKVMGNPTWQVVPLSSFNPALSGTFAYWSGVWMTKNGSNGFICGYTSKVYATTDYGNTWQERTNGMSGTNTLFDIFFKSSAVGLVVGSGGVAYYTTNGGTTWIPQSTGTTQNLYAIHSAGTNWYISGANNTFLKFNPPSTWTSMNVSAGVGTFPIIEGLHFIDDLVGTFSSANSNGPPHVFRTTDGGSTWNAFPSQPPLGVIPFYTAVHFFNPQTGWVGNLYTGSQNAFAYTSNGGSTWSGHQAVGGGAGAISRMDFLNQQEGWASGGALGGGPIPTGFILKLSSGSPSIPNISTTQTSASFGVIDDCAQFKDTTIIVKNSGTAPLVIDAGGITFSQPQFSLVGPSLPLTIGDGQEAAVTIRWTPSPLFYGPIQGAPTMTVASNDPNNPNWVINLSGLRNFGRAVFASTTLTFSTLCVNAEGELTLVATTEGNVPPQLVGFQYLSGHDDLTLISPQLGQQISNPTDFVFRFKPGGAGNRAGSYRLLIGNPNCPLETVVTFTGIGKSNPISLSSSDVDFGTICAGSSKDLPITISNSGTGDASVISRQLVSGEDVFPNAYISSFGPIPGGGSAQYTVRFSPRTDQVGSFATTYRLIVGPCPDTLLLILRGVSTVLNITTIPQSTIVLGPIGIGESAQLPVTFTNNGTSPVTVASLRLSPPNPALEIVGAPSIPRTLSPGQNLNASVRYIANKKETISARVCIVLSDPCIDSVCVGVLAISEENPNIVTIDSLRFAVQQCETAVRDSFTVRNTGMGTLGLFAFNLEGADKDHFRVVRPSPPVSVAPNDSVKIVIEFNSLREGVSHATLVINHNDPKKGMVTRVPLTGVREVSEFTIDGDSVFSTCVNQAQQKRLVLRNKTPRNLQLTQLALLSGAPAFSFQPASLPKTVAPGDSLVVLVTFMPTSSGEIIGTLEFRSEPCSVKRSIQLRGEGGRTTVVVAPSPIDFGIVRIGQTATQIVTINNTGTESVTVSGLFFRPSNSALSFVSQPVLPFILAGGASRQISIQYKPTVFGLLLSSLCVVTSAPCVDTTCTTISGRAQSDGLSFDKSALDFLLDPCSNTQSCDTIRLINNSSSSISVNTLSIVPSDVFTFSSTPSTPFVLNTAASQALVICARSNFTGVKTAMLVVESTDPNNPKLEFPLTATRDSIGVLTDQLRYDFGNVASCLLPSSMRITLRNIGTASETIALVQGPSNPFSITSSLPLVISGNDSAEIGIAFSPSATGSFADSIILKSSRCDRLIVVHLAGVMNDGIVLRPSPLDFGDVRVGTSTVSTVFVENLFASNARIVGAAISPSSEFTLQTSFPIPVSSGASVGIPVRFTPSNVGDHSATICFILDQPCPDTVCVSVTGRGVEQALVFAPSPLDFDTLAQCEEQTLSDTLTNTGSSSVTLQSSAVFGAGAQAFSILNPVTANEVLTPGMKRVFTIRFSPASEQDGQVQAVLRVMTDDPNQSTVELPLEGTRVTQRMPSDQQVSFGTIDVNVASTQSITLTNNGTSALTFTSYQPASNVMLTPPLPITLLPGQSRSIDITWTPDASGNQSLKVALIAGIPCLDSTMLTLDANVRGGIVQRSLDFGIVPNCITTDSFFVVKNELTKPLDLISILLSGADASFFAVQSPTNFPVTIPAGDSILVIVRFQPLSTVERDYTVQCFSNIIVDGQTLSVPSTIRARAVTPAMRALSIVNFGDVSLGLTSGSRTATFINPHPFPVRIATVQPGNSQFTIQRTVPPLPAVIQPNDTLFVDLTFSPAQEGNVIDSIRCVTDVPCSASGYGMIRGNGVDNFIRTMLSIPSLAGKPDEVIRIPVMLNTDIGSANTSSWEGTIQFNPSMLYPLRIITENSLSQSLSARYDYEQKTGRLTMTATGANIPGGTGALIFIECLVLIGDNTTTPLVIDPAFDFTSGLARVTSRSNGDFTLNGYCLADGNKRLVRTTGAFNLQNYPNPFRTKTTITYELPEDGFTELHVFDVFGRTVATLVSDHQTAGSHTAVFNVETFTGSAYYYVLKSGANTSSRTMLLLK